MKVFLIEEKKTYMHDYTMPAGYALSVNQLSRFLKSKGYYIDSHAQSAKAITKHLTENGYCQFYYDKGRAFKSRAGVFSKLNILRIKD